MFDSGATKLLKRNQGKYKTTFELFELCLQETTNVGHWKMKNKRQEILEIRRINFWKS